MFCSYTDKGTFVPLFFPLSAEKYKPPALRMVTTSLDLEMSI
jgi:hypothetical protein